MIRTAAALGLLLLASIGGVARAQAAAPRSYTLEAAMAFGDRKATLTVVRDGARERIELAIDKHVMASLFDFEAHRVYWIGWSGAGSCSSGRYLSARAPADQDPVTGTAADLSKATGGRARKAAGKGTVAGRAARIEALVGGKRPTGPDAEPWPTRAWLDEDAGFLLKLEGEAKDGKPVTLFEVTKLALAKPAVALLEPPPGCISTDSEMDDTGSIRSRAVASTGVQASATADLGSGTTSATVTQSDGKAPAPRPAGALARLGAFTLTAEEQPAPGPCGAKLQLTGSVAVDGPAKVKLQFVPGAGGLRFTDGDGETVMVEAAGSATLVREAAAARSLSGQVRLRAQVIGTKGHDGPLRTSDPVPFQVVCGGK